MYAVPSARNAVEPNEVMYRSHRSSEAIPSDSASSASSTFSGVGGSRDFFLGAPEAEVRGNLAGFLGGMVCTGLVGWWSRVALSRKCQVKKLFMGGVKCSVDLFISHAKLPSVFAPPLRLTRGLVTKSSVLSPITTEPYKQSSQALTLPLDIEQTSCTNTSRMEWAGEGRARARGDRNDRTSVEGKTRYTVRRIRPREHDTGQPEKALGKCQ